MSYKRPKRECEVCGVKGVMLDRHHIIPRTDPRCTDLDENLAVICANCHRRVHANEIIIEGVFFTSVGKKLFYHEIGSPYIIREGVHLLSNGLAQIRGQNGR